MFLMAILAREEEATTITPLPPPPRRSDTGTPSGGGNLDKTQRRRSENGASFSFLSNAPTPVGPFHDATPPRPFFDCHAPRAVRTAKFFELAQKRTWTAGNGETTTVLSPGSSWWRWASGWSDVENFFCRDDQMDDGTSEDGAIKFSPTSSTSYRIDPHASWWNGKVGLYEILRGQVCQRIRHARGHELWSHDQGPEKDVLTATAPGDGPDVDVVAEHVDIAATPGGSVPAGGARCRSPFLEPEGAGAGGVEDLISVSALDGRVRVQVHLESGALVALLVAFVAHYLYLLFVVYRRRRKDTDVAYYAPDPWAKTAPGDGNRFAEGRVDGRRIDAERDRTMTVPPSVAAASMMSALSLLEGDSSSSSSEEGDDDESDDDELNGLDELAQEQAMLEEYSYHHVQNAQELSLDAVGPVVPCRNVLSSALDVEFDGEGNREVSNACAAPERGDDGEGDGEINDLYVCLVTEVPIEDEADDGRAAVRRAEIDAVHDVWVSRMKECGKVEVAGRHTDEGPTPYERRLRRAMEASAIRSGRIAGDSMRDGMMILRASSLEEAHVVAACDPYHQECVCTYRVMPLEVPCGPEVKDLDARALVPSS